MSYYEDSKNVTQYIEMCKGYDGSKLYTLLQKYLESNKKLLELGSGPGIDLEILNKIYKVTGSDNSDEFLKRLKEKFCENPIIKLDVKDIINEEKYDCIYSNKVLHHINSQQLIDSLKQQKTCLNKGGIIAHSFWIGEEDMQMHGLLFTYYTKTKILEMINKDYEVLEFYGYSEFEKDDSLFVIARMR